MLLMGKANWWFPSWLSWVPRIHMEPENHVEDLEPAGVA
jgi:RND superfamily putative drug exporter